jgi:hypothetical protein
VFLEMYRFNRSSLHGVPRASEMEYTGSGKNPQNKGWFKWIGFHRVKAEKGVLTVEYRLRM